MDNYSKSVDNWSNLCITLWITMLTNLQTRVIFNGIDLSGYLAYLAIGFVSYTRDYDRLFTFPEFSDMM